MVEGRVDHARRHAVGDPRTQDRAAGPAVEHHPIAAAHAALLGVVRMDLQHVLFVPHSAMEQIHRSTISIGERFRSGFGRDSDDEFVIAD
jgi:hypothetical protein